MKKKISVLAAVLLAFGLAACGNNAAQATNDTTQTRKSRGLARNSEMDLMPIFFCKII